MSDLSEILAEHRGAGYVIAPAGFGKTYLIAESSSHSIGRQLILTHTHAGVNALRQKMSALGVSGQLFHIDTIASWSLRLSLSYSSTSRWNIERPDNNQQWNELYEACASLLDYTFIRRIILTSYAGLYVDEYQDCSTAQHNIVLKLMRDLPTRILGDPLQGIFDINGQNTVDWTRDIEGKFEPLGELDTPHRWVHAGTDELGEWLRVVRVKLEQGQPINLNQNRPAEVKCVLSNDPRNLFQQQGSTCRYFRCDQPHTVIAIHKGSGEYKAKCHALSRTLSGTFSSIEEIEGRNLFSFIRKIEVAVADSTRLKRIIEFAGKCMTTVNANLPAGTRRGERVNINDRTKNPDAALKANEYLNLPNSATITSFLLSLKNTPAIKVTRADLFNRALGVLRKHMLYPDLTLMEAAEKYHGEFRYRGRPVGHRKLIGTTLLVKGLEFDHAIVLDATSLSKRELYVALTRGARSLTIITTNPILNPVN